MDGNVQMAGQSYCGAGQSLLVENSGNMHAKSVFQANRFSVGGNMYIGHDIAADPEDLQRQGKSLIPPSFEADSSEQHCEKSFTITR